MQKECRFCKFTIYNSWEIEGFSDYYSFVKKRDKLLKEGTILTYLINSKEGKDYFVEKISFKSRMKELQSKHIGFYPFVLIEGNTKYVPYSSILKDKNLKQKYA